jgi:hypothetical protein
MRELSEKKLEEALRYKDLLKKAEEAKKRGEKRKFSKECGVSISSLNRLKQRYDREGFLIGAICIENEVPLLTRNVLHFERMKNLIINRRDRLEFQKNLLTFLAQLKSFYPLFFQKQLH